MPVIGPQIHNIPAGFHFDDEPQVHFLEPKENNMGGVSYVPHGEPAQVLLNSGMDLGVLRPYWSYNKKNKRWMPVANLRGYSRPVPVENATLLPDEWKQIDGAVLKTARKRMGFYMSLSAAGLTTPLTNPFGTMLFGWDKMQDDDGDAAITMEPDVPPLEGRPTYDRDWVPIPLITKGFRLNLRELDASRKYGEPLSTSGIAQSTLKVTEAAEKLCLHGTAGTKFGGAKVYGATNYPSRLTGSLTAAWTESAANPHQDTLNMVQATTNNLHYGPYFMYIPTAYSTAIEGDHSNSYSKSIRQRMLETEDLNGIKKLDYLDTGNVLLLEHDEMSVRILVGFEPRTIQWATRGGMSFEFMIMACIVPNYRADANGRTGITHYSI